MYIVLRPLCGMVSVVSSETRTIFVRSQFLILLQRMVADWVRER